MSLLLHFTEVDLAKTTKHGSDELTVGPTYLCLKGGNYYVGKFNKVWYGLTFDGWGGHFQYDPPSTNSSDWQRAWRFDNARTIQNQQDMWEHLTASHKKLVD